MIVQLLEVLIGLALVFLVFSTVASSLVETVEMKLKKRGRFLEDGIREILAAVSGQRDKDRLQVDLKTFYESPFISSLFRDRYETNSDTLPSYIPAERFVDALLQLAREKDSTFESFVARMRDAIGLDGADVETLRAQCMRYFNESMERVSGWYQRHARKWLLGVSLLIATLCNVDTIQLMRLLSQDDTLRQQIVEAATLPADGLSGPDPSDTVKSLQLAGSLGLPIGWSQAETCRVFQAFCPEREPGSDSAEAPGAAAFLLTSAFWMKVLGVLLTTFALSFGAPFWFDLLNELVNLRSSIKPKENEPDRTAAASTKPQEESGDEPEERPLPA